MALLLMIAFGGIEPITTHGPMCSRSMPSAVALANQLKNAPDLRRWRSHEGVMTYFDDVSTTLWWVASRRQAAFPATMCRQIGGPVRVRCDGPRNACLALSAKMARAKF